VNKKFAKKVGKFQTTWLQFSFLAQMINLDLIGKLKHGIHMTCVCDSAP
jgi:hypothetical protein